MLKFWMSACRSACISYSGFVMEMAPEGPTDEEIISVPYPEAANFCMSKAGAGWKLRFQLGSRLLAAAPSGVRGIFGRVFRAEARLRSKLEDEGWA
jgi:hypothetical protein